LLHCNAIIVDENDVGRYIDALANLKAVVTNDIVQINRKFKDAISFRFWGFMVQCVNDLPRIRDKSDSFYRRQILVPMDKCFTGAERRYIKDDYLSRPEVLEYVLKKVLNTNFYELSIPSRCCDLLGSYKELNDPIRAYMQEFKDRFVWDLVPTDFLYDLYKSWYIACNPSGKPDGKHTFKKQLDVLLKEPDFRDYWEVVPNPISIAGKMDKPEPLIAIYNLSNWKNKSYTGTDIKKISTPAILNTRYRGIRRCPNCPPPVDMIDITDVEEAADSAANIVTNGTTSDN
jgi:putative DNA primase/helicase